MRESLSVQSAHPQVPKHLDMPTKDSAECEMMEWTEKEEQQLAEACAGTTIRDIPNDLLMDVFEHFDAVSRLRKTMVCEEWEAMLNSRQLTRKNIFLDFDFHFKESDLPGRLKTLMKATPTSETLNHFENKFNQVQSLISNCLFRRFDEADALYVRITEPLRTIEALTREKNSETADNLRDIIESEFISPLLAFSQARRIVFCDSMFEDGCLAVETVDDFDEAGNDEWVDVQSHQIGFNRPTWTTSYVEEICLRNCVVLFEPIAGEPTVQYQKGTVVNLSFRLETRPKYSDIICAARDASSYRPADDLFLKMKADVMGFHEEDVEEFSGFLEETLKDEVANIPEDISHKPISQIDFPNLKHSSLYLLSRIYS